MENSHSADKKNKETVFSYENGDMYTGEMLNGLRNGRGTLRTCAAENAGIVKWHEYIGEWVNDKMHGCGVHLWKSRNGAEITMFYGEWINGQPQRNRRLSESSTTSTPERSKNKYNLGIEEELELEIFGY